MDDTMNLGNICGGRILEVFDRSIANVLKNIADPSTPAEQKRGITIKITFEPAENRELGTVAFQVEEKLAGVKPQKGNFFIARRADGSVRGFARDPKQVQMFAEEPIDTSEQ